MNSVQPIGTTTKDTVRKELDYLSSLFNGNQDTVTSLYASRHPAFKCPKDAIDFLLKQWAHHERSEITNGWDDYELTDEQLDDLAKYGQFPQRPSDLFLKVRIRSSIRRTFQSCILDLSWCASFTRT